MRLTKLQRHTAYILILDIIQNNGVRHVCTAFEDLTGIELDEDREFSNFKLMLPELWRKRDEDAGEWSISLWQEEAKRIKAIKQCISETY